MKVVKVFWPSDTAREFVTGAQWPCGVRLSVDSRLAPMPVAGQERSNVGSDRVRWMRGGAESTAPTVRLSKWMSSFAALARSKRSKRIAPTMFDGAAPCEMTPNETPLKKNSDVFAAV